MRRVAIARRAPQYSAPIVTNGMCAIASLVGDVPYASQLFAGSQVRRIPTLRQIPCFTLSRRRPGTTGTPAARLTSRTPAGHPHRGQRSSRSSSPLEFVQRWRRRPHRSCRMVSAAVDVASNGVLGEQHEEDRSECSITASIRRLASPQEAVPRNCSGTTDGKFEPSRPGAGTHPPPGDILTCSAAHGPPNVRGPLREARTQSSPHSSGGPTENGPLSMRARAQLTPLVHPALSIQHGPPIAAHDSSASGPSASVLRIPRGGASQPAVYNFSEHDVDDAPRV